MKKTFLLGLLFLIVFPLFSVQAAGLVPCGGTNEEPCTFCHLFVLLNNVLEFLMFKIVPLIASLMLVVGGIMFFFGGTNPGMIARARRILTSVVIGLTIIFCAWMIINVILVQSGFVDAEKGKSILEWWKITCE